VSLVCQIAVLGSRERSQTDNDWRWCCVCVLYAVMTDSRVAVVAHQTGLSEAHAANLLKGTETTPCSPVSSHTPVHLSVLL